MMMKTSNQRLWLLTQLPRKSIGAEIGVWKGDYSAQILKYVNPIRLFLIDPWLYMPEYDKSWYGNEQMNQEKMDWIAAGVRNRFSNELRVIIHRTNAGLDIISTPLDWVYIDGDHTYQAVKKDLEDAHKKVRHGGLICGDDYGVGWWGDGVIRAVKEFTKHYDLNIETRGSQYIIVNER